MTNQVDELLLKAADKRTELFAASDTNCFRLANGAGDGLDGFAVDLFGDWLLLHVYERGVLESGELKSDYMDAVYKLADFIPVDVKGILLKNKIKPYTGAERQSLLLAGSVPPKDFFVLQNGTRAFVDLIEGQNTGLFLDMREVRTALSEFYKQGEITSLLNLFCYTGFFSVHAIMNGVSRAVNVDLSGSVLKRAKKNYELNGIYADDRNFIRRDAAEQIKILSKQKAKFSLVIIDPPTFARGKKKSFSVRDNYSGMLKSLSSIAEGGYVFSSLNTVSLSREDYFKLHPREWENVLYINEACDFTSVGNPYLKTGLWKIP